ncbi:MAG: hypothetical protein ACXV5R_02640 [Candidatus Angelobacter sp.]
MMILLQQVTEGQLIKKVQAATAWFDLHAIKDRWDKQSARSQE